MTFRHRPLPAALLLVALLSPWAAHADVAPRQDVLGQFLLGQQAHKPLARGFGERVAAARHKAATRSQAQLARSPSPAAQWPGQPAPQASAAPCIVNRCSLQAALMKGEAKAPSSYGFKPFPLNQLSQIIRKEMRKQLKEAVDSGIFFKIFRKTTVFPYNNTFTVQQAVGDVKSSNAFA